MKMTKTERKFVRKTEDRLGKKFSKKQRKFMVLHEREWGKLAMRNQWAKWAEKEPERLYTLIESWERMAKMESNTNAVPRLLPEHVISARLHTLRQRQDVSYAEQLDKDDFRVVDDVGEITRGRYAEVTRWLDRGLPSFTEGLPEAKIHLNELLDKEIDKLLGTERINIPVENIDVSTLAMPDVPKPKRKYVRKSPYLRNSKRRS